MKDTTKSFCLQCDAKSYCQYIFWIRTDGWGGYYMAVSPCDMKMPEYDVRRDHITLELLRLEWNDLVDNHGYQRIL